jgi:hypothetical protein
MTRTTKDSTRTAEAKAEAIHRRAVRRDIMRLGGRFA